MNIEYLVQILENKLTALKNAEIQAFSIGDIENVNVISKEILDTQSTLAKLNLLKDIDGVAASTNTSVSDVVINGINAMRSGNFTMSFTGTGDMSVLSQYDTSSYATDPLYEQKIINILAALPEMNNPEIINQYIQSQNPGSPVTGEMIFGACQNYGVDTRLVTAMLSLESGFGTLGVGAMTQNPGNVGNTDSGATRTYASWYEGVSAVAQWLNRHKISIAKTPEVEQLNFVSSRPVNTQSPDVIDSVSTTSTNDIPVTSTPEIISTSTSTETGTTTIQQDPILDSGEKASTSSEIAQ